MSNLEIKELLNRVLAQQAVLYKKLDSIENKVVGSTRLASMETYASELKREADRLIQ